MKIQSLKLKGFIGIQRGLGLEEISVDLSKLSGLIALAGQNGKGKSTVLESLQPYRTLASRNTSLKNHVYLRDSSKELTFTLNGDEFRTLVKIDSGSDRSEGFIWRNGQPQVDGKVRSFDRYLVDLLGSPELFFNSVFAAQGSKKISDLTTGELKKLFSEFLRLDRLEAFEATSKQAAGAITLISSRIAQDIAALNGIGDEIVRLKLSLQDESAKSHTLQTDRDGKFVEMGIHEQAALKAAEAVNKNGIINVRLEETRKQSTQARADYEKEKGAYLSETDVLKTAYRTAKIEIDGLNTLLADEPIIRKAAEDEKAATKAYQDAQPAIEEQQTKVNDLTDKLHTAEIDHNRQTAADTRSCDDLKALAREKARLAENGKQKVKDLLANREVAVLEMQLKACEEKVATLEKTDPDCPGRRGESSCEFIRQAKEAEANLPKIQKDLSAIQQVITEQIRTLGIDIEKAEAESLDLAKQADLLSGGANIAAQTRMASINALKVDLVSQQDILKDLKTAAWIQQKNQQKAALLAARLPEIDQAAGKLVPAQARLKEIADEGIEKRTQWEAREKNMLTSIAALEGVAKTQEGAIDKEAETKQAAARQSLEDIRAQIAQADKEIAATETRIVSLQRDVEESEKKLAQKISLEAEKTAKEKEASEWIYLKNACGASGLRALEIDSVAPTITGWANDLLSGTFGPQYTVQFRTLDPDTGREILDILALADDGSEILLENLSGGQRVWILKALRLAMTLVSKEKSGMDLRSSFADEEDGALDVLNAQSFIQMYRAFMKSGGFDDCYFISHRPECVEMADHILTFREGGIDIE